MKVKTKPVVRTFKLKTDPDGEAAVTIRQARTGDEIELSKLFDELVRTFDGDGDVKLASKWNPLLIERKRAYLTLCGTTAIVDEDNNDLFRFKDGKNGATIAMNEREFNRAWGLLDTEVTKEISGYVIAMNPQWDPLQGE